MLMAQQMYQGMVPPSQMQASSPSSDGAGAGGVSPGFF